MYKKYILKDQPIYLELLVRRTAPIFFSLVYFRLSYAGLGCRL